MKKKGALSPPVVYVLRDWSLITRRGGGGTEKVLVMLSFGVVFM